MAHSGRENVFCKYSHRDCTQNCLDGYDYCLRHILEDKAAPYRQCAYVTKAGRKCTMAAPKLDKKEVFCMSHTKKALLARQKFTRKARPKETSDFLLEELVASTSSAESISNENRRGKTHSDSVAAKALEYASSSDSESDSLLVENAWRDSGDSDADSIDSDQEDILKYAGIYTTEEVAQILRDKLIRLQALYIDQFKRLKHILLTQRKKYIEARKIENKLYGSVKRYKEDPEQRELYEKLRAMKRYHKKYGLEKLLHEQSTQRRFKVTEGMEYRVKKQIKCSFTDEGVCCTQPVVPLSKFCQKHILHDQHQVLYQPCPFADSQCGRPVATLLGSPFCSLHQALPPDFAAISIDEVEEKDRRDIKQEVNSFGQQNLADDARNSAGLKKTMKEEIQIKSEISESRNEDDEERMEVDADGKVLGTELYAIKEYYEDEDDADGLR